MEQIDILLTNAIVLTMDSSMKDYPNGAVAIKGDSIVAVGESQKISQLFEAKDTIDCNGMALLPGLVNAHTHVPMTLLRGLADDLRLDVWLLGYMMPVEREFVSPDFVNLGTKLACAEMIRSGVTSFADMYYYEEDVARTVAEVGMRAVCSQTVMKFPTPDAASFEESLAYSREFIKRWKGHQLIVPSVAPHAPYTCTPEILKATAELAIEFDVPLHIHISETALEVENMRKEQGMPVVPWIKKQGLLEAKVLAAHCVHIDEGEMRSFLHAGTGIAHNPSSNMKLASGAAPVTKMLEVGLNVGIGTDGPASNNDLDMFEEIRLATFLAKCYTGDPTALPAQQTLLMATRLGAQALHIGHLTGSIEVGKRADIILVDLRPTHNSPQFQRDPKGPYAQIVYASKASDVQHVIVNGKFLMRDHKLISLSEPELLLLGQEYARKIDIFLMEREGSLISKLIAIGGAAEEESFEVQVKVEIDDPDQILEALENANLEIIRRRHYQEYDTYFLFQNAEEGFIRYREDHFLNENGEPVNVRSRLTLIGPIEHRFPKQVLLSRSRYLAPASQSLRFYREYFKPTHENEVEKNRRRFLVRFKDTEFFINIDKMLKPEVGNFLEIKSRTWSRQDAENKSRLSVELMRLIGVNPENTVPEDYIEMLDRPVKKGK